MERCSLCGSSTSLFSKKKLADGVICEKCMQKLPGVLHGSLHSLSASEAAQICDYEGRMREKEFIATASYGALHIDEINGLAAVCEKIGKDGGLSGPADVFDFVYLENVGLAPTNVRQDKKGIICDVDFRFNYRFPKMQFQQTVRRVVTCDYKRVSKTRITWTEPGELTMFQNMLDQTVANSVRREMRKRAAGLTPYDLDMLKARAWLHVYEGCPDDVIEKQYAMMTQMYKKESLPPEEEAEYLASLEKNYFLLSAKNDRNTRKKTV